MNRTYSAKEEIMKREDFEIIMDGERDLVSCEGDNAFLGLQIIVKYLPKSGVEGADHDIIYSADVDKLLEAGLTEDDAIQLRKLNWIISEDCLACFV